MEIVKESDISGFVEQYENLMSLLQQAAELGTFRLEEIEGEIRGFYKQTFMLIEHLADLKSLPLEELRIKKLLLTEWLEMVKNRTYMPNQHFKVVTDLATEENNGVLPLPVASADRKSGKIERYYQVGLSIRWHYDYFTKGMEKVLSFLSEVTKPYQTTKSLDNLKQDHDKDVGNMLKEYLTTTEAADLLKTSVKTVLRRIEKGQLKATKHGNAPYRIRRLDVELWLAGH